MIQIAIPDIFNKERHSSHSKEFYIKPEMKSIFSSLIHFYEFYLYNIDPHLTKKTVFRIKKISCALAEAHGIGYFAKRVLSWSAKCSQAAQRVSAIRDSRDEVLQPFVSEEFEDKTDDIS